MNSLTGFAVFLCLITVRSYAQESYIAFDDGGNMKLSGPFELTIPKPGQAEPGGPIDSSPSLLDEELRVSKAGYFSDDEFIVVQVETTNAGPGTMSDKALPSMNLAGEEFRARKACIDISQADLDAADDPIFEFIEEYDVQVLPAVMAMQLLAVDDSGSALGTVLFMRNVEGGCAAMTSSFEAEFTRDFERFIESVRAAN